MPSFIPQYTQENVSQNIPQGRAARPSDFGSGDALRSAARSMGQAGEALIKYDQQNQTLEAEKTFSKAYLAAQTDILKLRETATGDEDLTAKELEIYDKYSETAMKDARSGFQRKYLESKFVGNRDNVGLSSLQFEAQLKSQKRLLDFEEKVDAARNIVLGDPTQFRSQAADLEATLELVPMNGVAKEQARKKMREGLAASYIGKLTEINPGLAKKELGSELINSMITPEGKLAAIHAIDNRIEYLENQHEKALNRASEKNAFEVYNRITDPKAEGGPITQPQIVQLVRDGKLKGSDGRTLINLLNSDEAREDDLTTFAELSREDAAGTLTPEDVIQAHASGNLKTATARSMIAGITSNLSQNESYKSGQSMIRAEFDKTDFGATPAESASREAEALREFQRRAAAPQEGETIDGIADDIVARLRKTSSSDRAYQRKLSEIRRETGARTNDVKSLEETANRIMEAGQRGAITKQEMEEKLAVLQRRIQEIEEGIK